MENVKMELQEWKFEDFNVRTVKEGDIVLFVTRDIGVVLGYKDGSNKLLNALDDDEKGVRQILTLGGEQTLSVVTESGLYRILMRSNKPYTMPTPFYQPCPPIDSVAQMLPR